MKILSNKYFLISSAFLIFSLFWMKSFIILDPDFGWRLRAGEIYANKGIPGTDIFTYTMPSFPWVDHAWLQSLFFYFLYKTIGKAGLAILMATISYLALMASLGTFSFNFSKFFGVKSNLSDPFRIPLIFPFWLGASILISSLGIRVQVLSWLMLAVLLNIVFNEKRWLKFRKFSPFYFLAWANLHGGFVSGLSAWMIILVARLIRLKRINFTDVTLFSLSIFATLINPYGIGVWREVYSSVSDWSLRFSISEWMPSIFMFDLSMAALFTLSVGLLIRYRSKFLLEEKLLFFAFLFQAIVSRRHLPLWLIITLPIVMKSIELIYKEAETFKNGKDRFMLVYKASLFGTILIFALQSAIALWGAAYIREGIFYPKQGVAYLSENLPNGNIFSDYNWGGYLIWKLPERKVFVDGRMPSWNWDGPSGEEDYSFKVYRDIISGETEYKKYFEKYNIDIVFLPKRGEKGLYQILQKKLDNLLVGFGKEKDKEFDFLKALNEDGWQKVYEDEISVLYKGTS